MDSQVIKTKSDAIDTVPSQFQTSMTTDKQSLKEERPEISPSEREFLKEKRPEISLSEESLKGKKSEISLSEKGWIPDTAKKSYHDQRLSQSKWTFRLSFWGCIIGFAVIIWGMKKSVSTNNVEWIAIISGVVVDAVAALFFYLNNKANDKISEFFKELTLDSNKKDAQSLVHNIENNDIRDEVIVKLALHLSGIDDEKICKNVREVCKKAESDNRG